MNKKVNDVLIIIGGSDIRNITGEIVRFFSEKFIDINFHVIGHNKQVYYGNNVSFYANLDAYGMSSIMNKVDFAITGAGQTIYELIKTQTPFIPIKIIENQNNNIFGLTNIKLVNEVVSYDDANLIDKLSIEFDAMLEYPKRSDFVLKCKEIPLGLGSKNIIRLFANHDYYIDNINIRPVMFYDCYDAYKLSNMDYVRKYSISKEKILWTNHYNWFMNVLNNKNFVFYVVTDLYNNFLGQIKYSIENDEATIGISLDKALVGKGLSVQLLKNSIKLFTSRFKIDIIAYVYTDNTSSMKLFSRCGFTISNEDDKLVKFVYKNRGYNE